MAKQRGNGAILASELFRNRDRMCFIVFVPQSRCRVARFLTQAVPVVFRHTSEKFRDPSLQCVPACGDVRTKMSFLFLGLGNCFFPTLRVGLFNLKFCHYSSPGLCLVFRHTPENAECRIQRPNPSVSLECPTPTCA